jgi:hypothetical protein
MTQNGIFNYKDFKEKFSKFAANLVTEEAFFEVYAFYASNTKEPASESQIQEALFQLWYEIPAELGELITILEPDRFNFMKILLNQPSAIILYPTPELATFNVKITPNDPSLHPHVKHLMNSLIEKGYMPDSLISDEYEYEDDDDGIPFHFSCPHCKHHIALTIITYNLPDHFITGCPTCFGPLEMKIFEGERFPQIYIRPNLRGEEDDREY